MNKRQNSTVIVLMIVILFTACDGVTGVIVDMPSSSPGDSPPFVITKPVFEIVERPYYFNFAGIVFKFLNQGQEVVEKITVSFMLFDRRTQNSPFVGSNKFEIIRWDIIHPDENKEVLISLDNFIHIAPTEPYLIDSFYVSEIHYVNGSIWQDKYGKYRVRD